MTAFGSAGDLPHEFDNKTYCGSTTRRRPGLLEVGDAVATDGTISSAELLTKHRQRITWTLIFLQHCAV
jgi:hypothetical protein